MAEKLVPEERGAGHTGGAARRLATVQLAVFDTARGTARGTEMRELVEAANGGAAETTDNLASLVCAAPKCTQTALAQAFVLPLEFGETRRYFARRARRNESDAIAGETCKEAIERTSHWAPTPELAGRHGRADPNPSGGSEESLRKRNFKNLSNRIKSNIICGKIIENYFYKK